MKKYPSLTIPLTKDETIWGICYMIVAQLILPTLLVTGNQLLAVPLPSSKVNFIYYCLNFAAVLWIFRRFLAHSWKYALKIPFPVIWYAVLGYLGSNLLTEVLTLFIYRVAPDFININNQNVVTLLGVDLKLMAVSTVILVPVAEELLYRGVVFRGLYDKNRLAAYLTSMALFAAIHVVNYVGVYSPLQLLLAFLQYLPAAYCLCWAYRQTGTIAASILMHALVNAVSIYYAVR